MGELLCGDIQDMVLEQIPKLEINLGMRAINKIQSNKSCGCRALMPILSWVIVYKLKTESQSRTLKKNTGGGRKPAIENKHQEVMNLSFRDISKNCIVHNRHSKNMKKGWGGELPEVGEKLCVVMEGKRMFQKLVKVVYCQEQNCPLNLS